MSEYTEGSVVITSSPEEVMEVIEDFESYPEWAEVKSAQILSRDQSGRGQDVAFEVDVPVFGKANYTLTYVYAPGDAGLSWTTKDARGSVRDIRGEYLLNELEQGDTKVTYRLAVDLDLLVPGFVRSQGAKRVIENALERLKDRVELG